MKFFRKMLRKNPNCKKCNKLFITLQLRRNTSDQNKEIIRLWREVKLLMYKLIWELHFIV